jgi:membrane fusion protein
MLQPDTEPECSQQPLPLFRPEALAAQQQKFYGEILLIRPLSLTLFVWLGIGLASAVIAFLLLGHYTERIRVSGIILPSQSVGSPTPTSSEADLYVPARAMKFVHAGETVLLRASGDTQSRPTPAVVTEVSKAALSPETVAAQAGFTVPEPMHKVTLTVSGTQQAQNETRVEADLALEREPLLLWLFRPSGGAHGQDGGSSAAGRDRSEKLQSKAK